MRTDLNGDPLTIYSRQRIETGRGIAVLGGTLEMPVFAIAITLVSGDGNGFSAAMKAGLPLLPG